MKRIGLPLLVAAIALALLAALIVPGWLQRRSARSAVVSYNVVLAEALAEHKPELLNAVASPREVQRVANYITLLWGTGRRLDARLLSLEIDEYASSEGSMTVITTEKWSYRELDKDTRRALGDERTETQRIRYTLEKRAGESGYRVGLSETVEAPGGDSP